MLEAVEMLDNWKDLIKPKLEIKELNGRYGRFDLEPFERGFGTTIGNALRRILLSSLKGAAISSAKIDGVLHEFSTIDGVKEDVTDIILNLKEVRLRVHDGQRHSGTIEVDKEGTVTAADMRFGAQVEVLNPAQHIATLAPDAKLHVDLTVKRGSGYVPAEQNRDDEADVETIAMDTVFSPVLKVNFTVSSARVGQRTDYDKLTLEIWTDASISPEDALAISARIIQDQVSVVINFDVDEVETQAMIEEPEDDPLNEDLFRCVDELDLSVRSANCLQNADIKYVGELVQRTESAMLKTKNFGRKSLLEIKEILEDMGLGLGLHFPQFPEREALDRMRLEREGD